MKYFILTILLLSSCATLKDRRAVDRVTAKRPLLDQVFYEGLKIHPCANDSIYVTKLDTQVIVSTQIEAHRDTIFIKTTKVITRHDTTIIKVVDRLKIEVLTDTINSLKEKIGIRDGQITELREVIKSDKKERRNLWLIITGLILIVGVGAYLKLKGLFRS